MNQPAKAIPSNAYFFSPWIDFLLIGGFSFIALIAVSFLLPWQGPLTDKIIDYSFGVAFIINFPHFAFSYQLLYEDIFAKLQDKTLPRFYRLKMFNAAIIVPIALGCIIIASLIWPSKMAAEYMLSAMTFFVGWHYVKQGYGMLIVMSAKQRFFFTQTEKNTILVQTYAAWLFSWVMMNQYNRITNVLHDVHSHRIPIPHFIVIAIGATFIVSLMLLICEYAVRCYKRKGVPPFNAVIGYVAAVYLWNLALSVHPIFFAFIPAMHSLQYIMFVTKYKKTETEKMKQEQPANFKGFFNPFTNFFLIALVLGATGFFFIPYSLDYLFPLDTKTYGSSFFVFAFLIFINIHHYFIDNVIWRKENQKVRSYL